MLRDQPIRRKLIGIILLTSGAVLLVTSAALFAYELLTARRDLIQKFGAAAGVAAALRA